MNRDANYISPGLIVDYLKGKKRTNVWHAWAQLW